MTIMTVVHPENASMEIWFGGNLDLTMTREINRTCEKLTSTVRFCMLDLRAVVRVFDSGLGLILMLCHHLKALGAQMLVLGDFPEVNRLIDVQFGSYPLDNQQNAEQVA